MAKGVLNMDKINTSCLKENQIVKNYRELCAIVGEKQKTGNHRISQIKNWKRFFEFEKIPGTQKYKIIKIYDKPLDAVARNYSLLYKDIIDCLFMVSLKQIRQVDWIKKNIDNGAEQTASIEMIQDKEIEKTNPDRKTEPDDNARSVSLTKKNMCLKLGVYRSEFPVMRQRMSIEMRDAIKNKPDVQTDPHFCMNKLNAIALDTISYNVNRIITRAIDSYMKHGNANGEIINIERDVPNIIIHDSQSNKNIYLSGNADLKQKISAIEYEVSRDYYSGMTKSDIIESGKYEEYNAHVINAIKEISNIKMKKDDYIVGYYYTMIITYDVAALERKSEQIIEERNYSSENACIDDLNTKINNDMSMRMVTVFNTKTKHLSHYVSTLDGHTECILSKTAKIECQTLHFLLSMYVHNDRDERKNLPIIYWKMMLDIILNYVILDSDGGVDEKVQGLYDKDPEKI